MWNEITSAFPGGWWRAPLEILVLATGIYWALRFIRGTRAAPVVTGFLVLLMALTMLTGLLELQVLDWLLRSFFAFFVVAVLVIFHPELRRMLAELGNLPVFASGREQRENIEVVVKTCQRLAEAKIGALIAIERSIRLQEAVESGIRVDCEATPEMMESIFFPNNAIHDGGVILNGDRIAYAACIFPLTQRQDLNRSLGTRHRAAIGLTEETDAVVVVVSEESGAVSYAFKGQLTRGVSMKELRSFLSSLLVTPRKSRSFARWLHRRFAEEPAPEPAPPLLAKDSTGASKGGRA